MTYKVHQVRYDGQRYRSKTEARYAHIFDALDIAYAYEPEVVALPTQNAAVKYLPDFWLRDQKCWLEIKNRGKEPPQPVECWKAWKLAAVTGFPCFVCFGDPLGQKNLAGGCAYRYDPEGGVQVGWQFSECVRCHKIGLAPHGRVSGLPCACVKPARDFVNNQSQRILEAVARAKQHSFQVDGW